MMNQNQNHTHTLYASSLNNQQSQISHNISSGSPSKRRPKQKIEKSNEEFKEHERIIMDKRIAEINNVITKV